MERVGFGGEHVPVCGLGMEGTEAWEKEGTVSAANERNGINAPKSIGTTKANRPSRGRVWGNDKCCRSLGKRGTSR